MNKISFGMPQLLELESLEQNLKLATSLNLDYVELNMNLPQMQPNLLSANELIALAEKYQMTYTAHLPEDLDVGHFNKHIRKAYLKVLEDSIELAQAVGIKKLNMHMNKGIHFTLPTEKIEIYHRYEAQYLKNIRESLNRISTVLNKYDVTIVIENTG
ncbi:MAG: TIM barrel protein, partial [Turicibacter sp.]